MSTERHPRVGIVDVGTNSALLLIASFDALGLTTLLDRSVVIRLGEGVDGSGRVSVAALDRLTAALEKYAVLASSAGVRELVVVGTSASRDAENRAELCRICREVTGVEYNILSGTEEAELSLAGAICAYEKTGSDPVIVIDVGGGSTELISGSISENSGIQVNDSVSLNIGSVRVREREFRTDPPTAVELVRARAWVSSEFYRLGARFQTKHLIGASGTAWILWKLHASQDDMSVNENIDPVMTMKEVKAWSDRLLSMSSADVLSLDASIMSGREDVFGTGVMILLEGMSQTGAGHLRISSTGLRHGLALRYFGKV